MIGHLTKIQPWFSGKTELNTLRRLGDVLTFELEEPRSLHVQYLHPRDAPPQDFLLNSRYVIRDIESPPVQLHSGYWFDAETSRVLTIRELK